MTPADGVSVAGPGQIVGRLNAHAADLNNDGISDLIVGVPFSDGPSASRNKAGAVYVIFGQRQQPTPVVRDLAATKPDVIIYGGESGDVLGSSFAAGDVNGDRIADLILGAPGGDGPNNSRPEVGEVYVFFGGPSLAASPVRDTGSPPTAGPGPDVTIIGWGAPDRAGTLNPEQAGSSVAAGDINGDGLADIAIGAPGVKGAQGDRVGGLGGYGGGVYVINGDRNLTKGTVIDIGADPTSPTGVSMVVYGRTWSVVNTQGGQSVQLGKVGESLGSKVVVGDVDGNNLADLIIGAPFATSKETRGVSFGQGAAYVILGSRTPALIRDTFVTTQGPDYTVVGLNFQDFLGTIMAVGDVDGDGDDDMIFGIQAANGPGDSRPGAGNAYVVFGSQGLRGRRELEKQKADVVIYGGERGDGLGFALAAEDFNGDGVKDIILGAPAADGPDNRRDGTGEVYVVFGGTPLRSGSFRDVAAEAGPVPEVTIHGATNAEQVGYSVAVGDFNNDRKADIVTTAPFSDGPPSVQRAKAGVVYVVFGR
jgi:hypothetical protein